MQKINWTRLLAAAIFATVILFLTDGLMHEFVLHSDWEAVYSQLGARESGMGHGLAVVYFLVYEVGRGSLAILAYVLMRPFYGPGPRTAVVAGVVAWLAFSVTGPAQFIPLGFFSNSLWLKASAFQLITTLIATLAAAALYRDPAVPSETAA